MKNWWLFWWSVACLGGVGAESQGGLEARASQGRLESVTSWWKPAPDWEGRWWYNEGGGAVWLKAHGLEMGPLVASSGLEGQRDWAPSATLSSGHWGLGVDAESWGIWAIQRPEDYEAGVQAKATAGPWTFAAGVDRTWTLEAPRPSVPPWVDRGRLGLSWKSQGWVAGGETSIQRPYGDATRWFYRLRNTWTWPQAGLSLKASGFPWAAGAKVNWAGLSLGWEGGASDVMGRWEGGWKALVEKVGPWGLDGSLGLVLAWRQAGWTHSVVLSCDGPLAQGRWSAHWTGVLREGTAVQTLGLGWKESGFGFEALWRVEGLRLGWMGGGTTFDLTVNWSL